MKTGYEISLKDFYSLCSRHREDVGPMLGEWFELEIVPQNKIFFLRDSKGGTVNPELVHETIQADPERQGSIYRLAMTLWR